MTIDENKLNEFMGKIVGDLGVTMSSALLVLGDRLGTRQPEGVPVEVRRQGAHHGFVLALLRIHTLMDRRHAHFLTGRAQRTLVRMPSSSSRLW